MDVIEIAFNLSQIREEIFHFSSMGKLPINKSQQLARTCVEDGKNKFLDSKRRRKRRRRRIFSFRKGELVKESAKFIESPSQPRIN